MCKISKYDIYYLQVTRHNLCICAYRFIYIIALFCIVAATVVVTFFIFQFSLLSAYVSQSLFYTSLVLFIFTGNYRKTITFLYSTYVHKEKDFVLFPTSCVICFKALTKSVVAVRLCFPGSFQSSFLAN